MQTRRVDTVKQGDPKTDMPEPKHAEDQQS